MPEMVQRSVSPINSSMRLSSAAIADDDAEERDPHVPGSIPMGAHLLRRRRHPHSTASAAQYTTLQTATVTLQARAQMGPNTNRRASAHERAHRRPPDEMVTLYAEWTSPARARTRSTPNESGVDGG